VDFVVGEAEGSGEADDASAHDEDGEFFLRGHGVFSS
jgi:hypothetical protein